MSSDLIIKDIWGLDVSVQTFEQGPQFNPLNYRKTTHKKQGKAGRLEGLEPFGRQESHSGGYNSSTAHNTPVWTNIIKN